MGRRKRKLSLCCKKNTCRWLVKWEGHTSTSHWEIEDRNGRVLLLVICAGPLPTHPQTHQSTQPANHLLHPFLLWRTHHKNYLTLSHICHAALALLRAFAFYYYLFLFLFSLPALLFLRLLNFLKKEMKSRGQEIFCTDVITWQWDMSKAGQEEASSLIIFTWFLLWKLWFD